MKLKIILAKIAAQLVTFYTDLKKMQQSMNEVKSLSYFVNLADFKDWKKLFELKVNYFNCILNLYHAQQAEEQQSMAERVAYYQKASESLNEAHKWAKSVKSFQNVSVSEMSGEFQSNALFDPFLEFYRKSPILCNLQAILLKVN